MYQDLPYYRQLFDKFVEDYLIGSATDISLIQLKIDHTHRVYANAEKITAGLDFIDHETCFCALVSALFHDIGRFPQYQQYQTFNDRISKDHGQLGASVLKKEKFLEDLTQHQKQLIISCVALHNKKDLPRKLSASLRTICDIVRDSDKLDIFTIMIDHFMENSLPNQTITLNLHPHPTKYSKPLFDKVINKESCKYTDMYWSNDFKLVLAAWIYQFNFPVSYEVFMESGNFDRLFKILPSTKEFEQLRIMLTQIIESNLADLA